MSTVVKYYDTPQLERAKIAVESTGVQPFSQTVLPMRNKGCIACATPERQGWPLDGSRRLIPEATWPFWWSAQRSGEDLHLAQGATLKLQLPEPVTTTGLSFVFWPATDQWCSCMQVSWYSGGTLLRTVQAFPDNARWTLHETVERYDRVEVSFFATNRPGEFLKLESIAVGKVWTFTDNHLISIKTKAKRDLLLRSLPVDTMQICLRHGEDAPLQLLDNRAVELYRDGEHLATQFVCESARLGKQLYTLKTQARLGLLQERFLGGMYREEGLWQLLQKIMGDHPYEVYGEDTNIKLTGYLPVCTRREALRQLLIAAGGTYWENGEGTCCILIGEDKSRKNVFAPEQSFFHAKATTMPRYSRVEVAAHQYMQGTKDELLLHEAPVYGENVLLTFPQPHHAYDVAGGELVEEGVNYIRVNAWGPITVWGEDYQHTTQLHGLSDPKAVGSEYANVLQITNATLVNQQNVQQVLQRIFAAAQYRHVLQMDVTADYYAMGAATEATAPWGKQTRGVLCGADGEMTGQRQRLRVKIVGTEVES